MRGWMTGALGVTAVIAILFMVASGSQAEDRSTLPPSTTYSDGTKVCTECHDDEHASAIMSGPHGMAGDSRTPAANKG